MQEIIDVTKKIVENSKRPLLSKKKNFMSKYKEELSLTRRKVSDLYKKKIIKTKQLDPNITQRIEKNN